MKLSASLRGIGPSFAYYPKLAPIIGGTNACIFLCAIFWKTFENSDGWLQITMEQITELTGMSKDEQRTARARLKSLKILKEREERLAHKMFYKIDLNELDGLFEAMNPTDPSREVGNPHSGTSAKAISKVTRSDKDLRKDSGELSASPVVIFREQWVREYPKYHEGSKYVFQGAKDGAAIARLIGAGLTPEHLLRIAIASWQQPDGFNTKMAASIAGFSSRINEIRADLNTKRKPQQSDEPLRNVL